MIEVKVRKDNISITGHANYAPEGQDIVCAGISTLIFTLVNSIQNITSDEIEIHTEPGSTIIRYGNLSDRAKLLIDSFFVGVVLIADQYSDYVRIV